MSKDLQFRYALWRQVGMNLAHQFCLECTALMADIFEAYRKDLNPQMASLDVIPLNDNDTFDSVWFDEDGSPCCAACIHDGAPMGWKVEFLDLHHKYELHKILLAMHNELVPSVGEEAASRGVEEMSVLQYIDSIGNKGDISIDYMVGLGKRLDEAYAVLHKVSEAFPYAKEGAEALNVLLAAGRVGMTAPPSNEE